MAFEDVARRMQERHRGGLGLDDPGPYAGPPLDPIMEQVQADAFRAEQRARASRDIVFGIILLVVGVIITAATYSSASRAGGTYIIAYGPIVFGVIRIGRGLMRST
jgi:hypothetical protein